MSSPRFGIWVPVYGPWGARHHPDEPSQPSYAHSLEIVRQAELQRMAPASRRALLLSFAQAAADRLHRLADPAGMPEF